MIHTLLCWLLGSLLASCGSFGAATTISTLASGTSTLPGVLNVTQANSTSTFSGNLTAKTFNQTGTSATSTFAWGIDLSGGCVEVGGVCLDSTAYPSFRYATSTAWTGTTTLQLQIPWVTTNYSGFKCATNIGTLNIHFGYGTASTTMANASTTANTNLFSTNTSVAVGAVWQVSIGTPASSPTRIVCTLKRDI